MKKIIIPFLLFFVVNISHAQDTLKLSFEQGRDLLIEQNLKILAEHYNIDMAQAQIEQASLWDNPLFVWNAEMYSIAQNKYFNFNNQKLIQLEYAFSVSGKRINAIKEAKINKEIAVLAMNDVLRALVYEYSLNYYGLAALVEKNVTLMKIYKQFENIISLNDKKLQLGVISENDLVRLRSENLSLLAEINSNENEILGFQSELCKLMNLNSKVIVRPTNLNEIAIPNESVDTLLVFAKKYRPDYIMVQKGVELGYASLKKQKSEAIPNINLGYQPLDQGSNHVRPYAGMVFEMNIPLFNRNQGNINAAKVQIEQQKILKDYKMKEIELEINTSFSQLLNSYNLYQNFDAQLFEKIDELSRNAKFNYEKRNISLIEYIDYQRAFIETQKNYVEVKNNYQLNWNQLNFVTGLNITK